jgi:DNA-binding MarR family transcriptional regulator
MGPLATSGRLPIAISFALKIATICRVERVTSKRNGRKWLTMQQLQDTIIAVYNSKRTHAMATPVGIRGFRRDLRTLEREVVFSLSSDAGCCGVSFAQCHLLLEVEQRGTTSITELSTALQLDKSTLSRTVDSMVRTGLLKRENNPASRRQQVISLTAKGKQKTDLINTACDTSYARLFDFISAAKRRAVIASVSLLAEAMRQMRTQPDSACCALDTDD